MKSLLQIIIVLICLTANSWAVTNQIGGVGVATSSTSFTLSGSGVTALFCNTLTGGSTVMLASLSDNRAGINHLTTAVLATTGTIAAGTNYVTVTAASGTSIVTLPLSSVTGTSINSVFILNGSAGQSTVGTITVTCQGSDTFIGGATTITIVNAVGQSIKCSTDGSGTWFPISNSAAFGWGVDAAGNWNTSSNWYNNKIPNTKTVTAYFGPVLSTGRTVTLDINPTIGNISINSSPPFTFTGGTLTLDNNGATPTLKVSGSHTIGSILAGSSGLNKTGTGIISFTGSNTLTGTTSITAGTIQYDNAIAYCTNGPIIVNNATAQIGNNITSSGTYNLTISGTGAANGATGVLENTSGTNSIASPISLAANSTISSDNGILSITGSLYGAYNLAINNNSPGGWNGTYYSGLQLSTGTISNGGTITLSGTGVGAIVFNSDLTSGVTGLIQNSLSSPWYLLGSATNVFPITANAGTTYLKTSGASTTISIANPINSGTTGNSAVILKSSGTNTINCTAGVVLKNQDLVLQNSGLGDTLGITTTAISGTGNLYTLANTGPINISFAPTFVGSFTNSGTGAYTTTISGSLGTSITSGTQNSTASTLYITATNIFPGGFNLASGTLSISGISTYSSGVTGSPIGTGTLTIGNNTTITNNASTDTLYATKIALSGSMNIAGNNSMIISTPALVLNGGNTIINCNSKSIGVNITATSGTLTGNSEAAGLGSWEFNNGTGALTISNGTLDFESPLTSTTVYGTVRFTTATNTSFTSNSGLIVGPNTLLFNAGGFDTTNCPTLTINGIVDGCDVASTIYSLSGSGYYLLSMASAATTARTLTIMGTSGTTTFSGSLRDGPGPAALALTKNGASTLTMSGINIFSGATTISAGNLFVTGTMPAASAVAVDTSGTLGGTGLISGTVTVANTAGCIIMGGTANNAPETLTVSRLIMSGTNAGINVNTNGTTVASVITISGTFTTGVCKVNIMNTLNTGTYNIITAGGRSGNPPTVGTNNSGHTAAITRPSGNTWVLTISLIFFGIYIPKRRYKRIL